MGVNHREKEYSLWLNPIVLKPSTPADGPAKASAPLSLQFYLYYIFYLLNSFIKWFILVKTSSYPSR
jgi:hypothetical protein